MILQTFEPGDPIGAVDACEGWPCPGTAIAIDTTSCLLVCRAPFFGVLPTLVDGYVLDLAQRIVQLTSESRSGVRTGRNALGPPFLKVADKIGRREREGTFIPIVLSRQDLADLTRTTIEICIES